MWYQKLSKKMDNLLPPRTIRLLAALVVATFLLWVVTQLNTHRVALGKDALFFNIFLAAIPLFLSIPLRYIWQKKKHRWLTAPIGVIWLLFFPNAPYMITDLIHINLYEYNPGMDNAPVGTSWFGLVQTFSCVVLGCVAGYLGLYLLQSLIRKQWGAVWGWLFSFGVCALSGVAIYMGRFLRINSWEALQTPHLVIADLMAQPLRQIFLFCFLFFIMAFSTYALFYFCFDAHEE